MNRAQDIRKLILDWVNRDGIGAVEKRLIDRGLAQSTRVRLVNGKYPSPPGGLLLATLQDELKKAGLLREIAS
jgi:hypothetical protein